jgi:hypothetical protein
LTRGLLGLEISVMEPSGDVDGIASGYSAGRGAGPVIDIKPTTIEFLPTSVCQPGVGESADDGVLS